MIDFIAWPKTQRLKKDLTITVTEKIDGTNAQVFISPLRNAEGCIVQGCAGQIWRNEDFAVYAGSRTRYITPEDDNYGFAKWVRDNAKDLLRLGPGRHYGEWYGQGIQRNYGLDHKRFALFNVGRWGEYGKCDPPSCCSVVPVLYQGEFQGYAHLVELFENMKESAAVPGWEKPEGLWIYFHDFGASLKMPFDKKGEK